MNYFDVPSLGAQVALSKSLPSPAVSVVDERHAPPAASTMGDYVKDNDDWNLGDAIGLDDIEPVGTITSLTLVLKTLPC